MRIIGQRNKKFLDHCSTIDKLVRRLLLVGRYDIIFKNQTYIQNGLCGEFDVLTKRKMNDKTYYTYYEIKCTDTYAGYHHSLQQFSRAKQAFPTREWRFVYITPTRVERAYV